MLESIEKNKGMKIILRILMFAAPEQCILKQDNLIGFADKV
jgi:hypothetical protein